jgi:hypothetical protein
MSNDAITSIQPRLPTVDELRELSDYFGNDDEVPMPLDGTCIAVFDDYCTDGPGYRGKVVTIVWPSGPEYHHVLVWTDGVLKEVDRD